MRSLLYVEDQRGHIIIRHERVYESCHPVRRPYYVPLVVRVQLQPRCFHHFHQLRNIASVPMVSISFLEISGSTVETRLSESDVRNIIRFKLVGRDIVIWVILAVEFFVGVDFLLIVVISGLVLHNFTCHD